jgi:hypothetical protein
MNDFRTITTTVTPSLEDIEGALDASRDLIQTQTAHISVGDLARKCNDTEKKYCELIVFYGKRKKDAMRQAGSTAKEEYLSKMAYEVEQRPHVIAYMEELRRIRSRESQVEFMEVVLAIRRAIELLLADKTGKGATKAEPLFRLLAEMGGHIKAAGGATTAVQVNNTPAIGSPAGSTLTDDLERLQRITGG